MIGGNPAVRITRDIPDYIGYVFLATQTPGEPPGTLNGHTQYVSYIPNGAEEDEQKTTSLIILQVLSEAPQLGHPLPYASITTGVHGTDEALELRLRNVKPIGKFIVDEEGKISPYTGEKSVLLALDSSEVAMTAFALIKKAQASYFAALEHDKGNQYQLTHV